MSTEKPSTDPPVSPDHDPAYDIVITEEEVEASPIFYYARNLLASSASLPHVLTARAKGVGELRVLLRHILPVAAPQLLALAGISVSLAFAAAIPVEVLCDLPGIGQLAWKAAMGRDLELLVNLTMIVTLVTLLANSAADLMPQPHREGEA